jgi:hypothetical protein
MSLFQFKESNNMADSKPMWARLPGETERAFRAFQKYLKMLDNPDERSRSLHRLALDMGYKDKKSLEKWSSPNGWVERAAAYDEYMSLAIVERELDNIADYQQHVVESLTAQLAAIDDVINASLTAQLAAIDDVINATIAKFYRAQQSGEEVSTTALKRLVDALKVKDDLARRTAKLPTNYMSKPLEEEEEQKVFIIGGGDGETL